MTQSPIKIRNLTRRFGGKTVVDSLNLEVPRGKVFAFLGPNGAGKTTTIRMMLGLLGISSGNARVLDINSRIFPLEIRRKVGYVPEDRTFYGWMTVAETAKFSSAFHPTWDKNLAAELTDKFNLDPKQKIKELSKGMKAKVSLLIALAHKPALLILDEPTGGLDVRVRHDFLESIVALTEEGRTVFISSHLVAEVERVADMAAIINENHLLVSTDVDVLKEKTKGVTLRFESDSARDYASFDLLKIKRSPREDYIVTRDFSDELPGRLKSRLGPNSMDVNNLPLEEIYLAYTDKGNGG